jgi:hypothetical protein
LKSGHSDWQKLKSKELLQKLNPAIGKKYLILLAGLMWCGVGIMLVIFAVSWLEHYEGKGKLVFYSAGFIAAMPIHHFGFLRLADKNLARLLSLTEKKCLFSFITIKSYMIIIIMIALGITLRHSAIPKQYLSILYNGIGLGLFLSGIRYFRYSAKLIFFDKNPRSA